MGKSQRFKVILTADAERQYFQATEYLLNESEKGYRNFIKKFRERAALIADKPKLYSADKYKLNNNGAYRAFVIYNYRVTYKIEDKEVIILLIRHTSQEPKQY